MKVEIENLKTLKTLADNYQGEKKKGVSKVYIHTILKNSNIVPIIVDGVHFFDYTKLPNEIKAKIKF